MATADDVNEPETVLNLIYTDELVNIRALVFVVLLYNKSNGVKPSCRKAVLCLRRFTVVYGSCCSSCDRKRETFDNKAMIN